MTGNMVKSTQTLPISQDAITQLGRSWSSTGWCLLLQHITMLTMSAKHDLLKAQSVSVFHFQAMNKSSGSALLTEIKQRLLWKFWLYTESRVSCWTLSAYQIMWRSTLNCSETCWVDRAGADTLLLQSALWADQICCYLLCISGQKVKGHVLGGLLTHFVGWGEFPWFLLRWARGLMSLHLIWVLRSDFSSSYMIQSRCGWLYALIHRQHLFYFYRIPAKCIT